MLWSGMSSIISRIKHHISDRESHHHRIARDFVIVGLFVFIGKLIGAAKEMAIAWRYGTSDTVDAYVFITNFINWPISIWFGVLSIILIPVCIKSEYESPDDLQRFNSEVLAVTIILCLLLSVCFFIFFPFLVFDSFGPFGMARVNDVNRMAYQLLILMPLGFLTSLFSVWIMSTRRQSNSIMEAIPAAVLFISIVAPFPFISEPLIFGTVCGLIFQFMALFYFVWHLQIGLIPLFSFSSPIWKRILSGIILMTIGQCVMGGGTIIDQLFLIKLGSGQIAIYNYANRIVALIISIGVIVINRATLPAFSIISIRGGNIKKIATQWCGGLFVCGSFVVVFAWEYAHLIIRIIYEHGAFNPDNTNVVVYLFRLSLLQVPFFLSGMVFASVLASKKKYFLMFLIAVVSVLVKYFILLAFVDEYGIEAIVYSTIGMQLASSLSCWFFMRLE